LADSRDEAPNPAILLRFRLILPKIKPMGCMDEVAMKHMPARAMRFGEVSAPHLSAWMQG
jgi:hypothetical protein